MNIPQKPNFTSLVGDLSRFTVFGKFTYHVLADGNSVKIDGNWVKDNIIEIVVPQLQTVPHVPANKIWFNKKCIPAVLQMFKEWEDAGLMPYVLTMDGTFCPRLIRGGHSLSNHAFGSAIDLNATWNGLGVPPTLGHGTVIPLVEIANNNGFFWGGHYNGRLDGMHFEKVHFNDKGE